MNILESSINRRAAKTHADTGRTMQTSMANIYFFFYQEMWGFRIIIDEVKLMENQYCVFVSYKFLNESILQFYL